jgi:hypothetical protein
MMRADGQSKGVFIYGYEEKLPLDRSVADHFKGNWTKLNAEHKAKYAEAVAIILDNLKQNGVDCDAINAEVESVYEELKTLTSNASETLRALHAKEQPPNRHYNRLDGCLALFAFHTSYHCFHFLVHAERFCDFL